MSRSAIAMMLSGLVVTLGAAPRVSLTPRLRSEPSGQAEGPDGRATAPAHRTRVEQRLNHPVRWPAGLRTAQAESAAIVPALAQLRRDCPELPSIPVRVLTSGEKSKSAQ